MSNPPTLLFIAVADKYFQETETPFISYMCLLTTDISTPFVMVLVLVQMNSSPNGKRRNASQ